MAHEQKGKADEPTVLIEDPGASVIIADEALKRWQDRQKQLVRPETFQRVMVWYGMLPAEDAMASWRPKPQQHDGRTIEVPPAWKGRARSWSALSIKGIPFNTYHREAHIDHTGNSQLGPFVPGETKEFEIRLLDEIKEESFRRFIRKVYDDREPSLVIAEHKVRIETKEQEAEREKERREFQLAYSSPKYREDPSDVPFAHYVYMVQIKSKNDIPRTMEEFFVNPPKSLMGD